MSISSLSVNDATMNLGVVTVNNQRYLAILHFRDPEGAPRLITEQMKKTAEVSLKLFQDVLNKYPTTENFPINRVNSQGFVGTNVVYTHSTYSSEEAWKKFILSLETPTLAEELEELNDIDGTELELVDLSSFEGVDTKRLAGDLYQKISTEKESNRAFPELTEQEKLFLKYFAHHKNYPNLLAGNFNNAELNQLQIES